MATEETKEKIVETALQMFNSRGCRGVTMDDIAQALHMSKRTLYETFANKEELLAECLMRVHDQINDMHRQAHQKVNEPLLVAMYMLRVGADTNHRYHRLIEEAERYYPEIHDRFFHLHTEALHSMMKHGMEYVKSHNYLRPDADVDVAVDFLCDLMQQHRLSDVSDPKAYIYRLNEICFTYLRGLMNTATIGRYEQSETHFRQVLEELGWNSEKTV